MSIQLTGKTAIVTGATKGVGLACARAIAAGGANVFICARNGSEVDAVVEALNKEFNGRASGRVCDVRDPEEVHATVLEAQREFGGVDILINNAGIGSRNRVEDMPVEEWRATLETNLSGVFYFCHEAIPPMKERGGGYIINIGSLAGKNAFAGGSAYNASKFGLIGFSEALMQEVRYDHIRVSCVMPGSVNTTFASRGEMDPATTWKLLPEDVAEVVVNLLIMDPRALPSRVEIRPSEPAK